MENLASGNSGCLFCRNNDRGSSCYFIRSMFCWNRTPLWRVAPRILKHNTRLIVCLAKGKYRHLNFSFLFFHLLFVHVLWYLAEWLWRLKWSFQYHRIPNKVVFWLLTSEMFWVVLCVRIQLRFFSTVLKSMASLRKGTGDVTGK